MVNILFQPFPPSVDMLLVPCLVVTYMYYPIYPLITLSTFVVLSIFFTLPTHLLSASNTQLSLPSYREHALCANTLFHTTNVFSLHAVLIGGGRGIAKVLLLEQTDTIQLELIYLPYISYAVKGSQT